MHPNALVPIALFGWLPLVIVVYCLYPPRRAVIFAFLAAWLFLPMYGYAIAALPDYTKMSATCLGIFMATFLFTPSRITGFKPKWFDLPIVLWCLWPIVSSTKGGWGLYEGVSTGFQYAVEWAMPYFIGRALLRDLEAMRDLALGIFLGALVYAPLCLFEIKMSPQLHNIVYGYHAHNFLQTMRGGGWRPTVFMQHGLAVGLFMCISALIGFWLWRTKTIKAVLGIPMMVLSPGLLMVAVLCKSSGAIALLGVGGMALMASKWLRISLPMLVLALTPVAYMAVRTVGGWNGREMVTLAQAAFGHDRAGSLRTRLQSETGSWLYIQQEGLVLTGKGRFIPVNQALTGEADDAGIVPDGRWVIAMVVHGVGGLALFATMQVLPVLLFIRRYPARLWAHPALAPAVGLMVGLILYLWDNVQNAMPNPIFVLVAGSLSSLAIMPLPSSGRAVSEEAPAPAEPDERNREGDGAWPASTPA